MAHQAGAYPGFLSIKRLRVFLLLTEWDASPSQGYPPALNLPALSYTPGWREALWELSVLPKNTSQCPRPGLEPGPLDPETSTLTMKPLRLPLSCHNRGKNGHIMFERFGKNITKCVHTQFNFYKLVWYNLSIGNYVDATKLLMPHCLFKKFNDIMLG